MNYVLAAVNAKYIHSNLAVYCLKSYAASKGYSVEIAEYTINQQQGEVLRELYERRADVVAFSCYIWNIEFIKNIIRDYKKICPDCEIWMGGPEVSYRGEELLKELPEVRGIFVGEGEETFAKVVEIYENHELSDKAAEAVEKKKRRELWWQEVPGIIFREDNGVIRHTKPAKPLDFSRLPFPYGDGSLTVEQQEENGEACRNVTLDSFENRIIYYESSRGCPFSCAYCLSSVDRRVRFRDMDLVKKELSFFLDSRVPQVKFIDRTFNVNNQRTIELLQYIKEKDNGVTNFHCEIAAELLTTEQTALLNSLRPGLVQLEIGVQSTNEETLKAVNRKTELMLLKEKVAAVREKNNVHIHLDLIAGLPNEDLESFRSSFNEVYRMKPHQLQLGFLKVLSGAPMEQIAKEQEIRYQSAPPYEVLSTRWLSFADIILLKKVEELVEIYYNSGQFVYSMMYLEHFFASPFELYEKLARFYEERQYTGRKLSRAKRYEILQEFAVNTLGITSKNELLKQNELKKENKLSEKNEQCKIFEEILFFDYCLREKPKSRPGFGKQTQLDKQILKEAYTLFGIRRDAEGMHDVEQFSLHPEASAEAGRPVGEACYVLFSYEEREAMYGGAGVSRFVLQSKALNAPVNCSCLCGTGEQEQK